MIGAQPERAAVEGSIVVPLGPARFESNLGKEPSIGA